MEKKVNTKKKVFYQSASDMIDMIMMSACKCDASTVMYDALKLTKMIALEELSKEIEDNDD